MDIVIVSTSNLYQEEYWQHRSNLWKGTLLKETAHIICIQEDWPGGAGNGLGTLYAYQKASKKAKKMFGLDIFKCQEKGASVALYHTAGEGKRLYPLAASEFCNKSAVKLPWSIPHSSSNDLTSILEAAIYQTSVFAPFAKGRLSVFWGDQLFIPSNDLLKESSHHIEILTKNIPFPSRQKWIENGYKCYGCVIHRPGEEPLMFEKLDYDSFENCLKTNHLPNTIEFDLSLGCFSLSLPILKEFLSLFQKELQNKDSKLDSDIHFWMPLTLNLPTYVQCMTEKKFDQPGVEKHYLRMQSFKQTFCNRFPELNFFGTCNIGAASPWFDYGNIASYFKNAMLLIQNDSTGAFYREMFSMNILENTSFKSNFEVDQSLIVNSQVSSGRIKNSLLINVTAQHLDVDNCLIINSTLNSLKADMCLLYHVFEDTPLKMNPKQVRANLNLSPATYFKMYSSLDFNGKDNWETRFQNNSHSYSEIKQLVQSSLSKVF
jgi:hypothetical protein